MPVLSSRYICIYLIEYLIYCRLGIRACVVLIPLLGVTWLFGALSSTHKAFAYIFVIFNSTQVRWESPSLRMHYSSIGKLTVGAAVFTIRHLQKSHKAPYLPLPLPHPPPPLKKCIIISPGYHSPSQEKLKTMLKQNFEGQLRCIMGDVQVAKTELNVSFL